MKLTMKLLDLTLVGLLTMSATPALAQAIDTASTKGAGTSSDAANCDGDECRSGDGLLFKVRTRGADHPLPGELRDNRRVDVLAMPQAPGKAKVAGTFSVDLPGGGVVWATEDPTLGQPVLNVQAAGTAPFADGRITTPLSFHGYSNYAAFMRKLEVLVYRGTDSDRVAPLATITLPTANVGDASWDGRLPAGLNLRPGDTLVYVARAYGADGQFDETVPQSIQLQTPADYARGVQALRERTERSKGTALSAEQAQAEQIRDAIFGSNALRLQNIPIYGSRVRIHGRDVPADATLRINGEVFPVDLERKFVAEFLEPVGQHQFALTLQRPQAAEIRRTLDVDVTGSHRFLVAMADLTLSNHSVSSSVTPAAEDGSDKDGFIGDGRLAFYLKQKLKGKYLVTAQADTRDREVKRLFNGFLDADAQDVFRRLDPDMYYPSYGDDSTTTRDVDTQGRLYVRVDWDRNQALWGNFATGFNGTEYGQYNRSLYGAALSWRGRETTALGEAKDTLKLFGSQAQSAPGHSEFLGTGGSLYYLRQTDVLPGSDQVVLDVRDRRTGRTLSSVRLQRGADYEIDELQGRIILTRPLAQITRENLPSITRDTPLDGYDQLLLVDYEYIPGGFRADDTTAGVRGKHWFGEHLAVGATYVDEGRSGDDYTLAGADVTLQAGRGTYLKLEQSHTEAVAAPIFYSDNGGFSFIEKRPPTAARSGDARAVEARANFRELGWTKEDWSVGAWWRNVDPGFSISRYDTGADIREYGAEFQGYLTQNFSLYGQASRAERDGEVLEQQQLTADWRPDEVNQWTAELRRISQQGVFGTVEPALGALSYHRHLTSLLEVYGIAQYTLDDDHGRYPTNNLYTLGSKYQFGNRSTVGAEYSDGSRGHAAELNAEYWLSNEHSLYGNYRYSTDSTAVDPLFNPRQAGGWTVGQRWRLSNQVNLYNESQFLKDPGYDSAGLAHTFGMDFYPSEGWRLGFTLQEGQLDTAAGGVTRHAYSVSGGRTDARTDWTSKLEYRQDHGAESRHQWVTTNRLFYKLSEDWRLALRANYARTTDNLNALDGARLTELNAGFAFRPHDNTRWAAFGKYTLLYDLASPGQIGGATDDQRSQVLAFEGIWRFDPRWELAGKLAARRGEFRMGRGQGPWLDSRADFGAAQLRYHLIAKWDGLAEYRVMRVKDGGRKQGWLVGVDRQVGQNFKLGVGYNFTDFSDDLTHLRYDNKGWFLNMTGYY